MKKASKYLFFLCTLVNISLAVEFQELSESQKKIVKAWKSRPSARIKEIGGVVWHKNIRNLIYDPEVIKSAIEGEIYSNHHDSHLAKWSQNFTGNYEKAS